MPIEYEIVSLDPRLDSCSLVVLESQAYEDGKLTFVLQCLERAVITARYRVTFAGKVVAYRMILEECRLQDWQSRDTNPAIGLITPSTWVREMRPVEPLLDVHYPNVKHFTISTGDECYDILSADDPSIDELIAEVP